MNRTLTGIVLGIVLMIQPFSRTMMAGDTKPLSDRISNYTIRVSLDTETKKLHGSVLLTWKNPGQDTVPDLRFHLYLNAFKNTLSTFMKESGGQLRGIGINEKDSTVWGWIDIERIRIRDGDDLTAKLGYIHPDDDNADDRTVARVVLDDPVLPGQILSLEIDFVAKLPRVFARSGFSDDFFFVGQWFPKIGVYEPAGMRQAKAGRWNCHQYHANSEFYSDFGVYQVSISLPVLYRVGATGVLVDSTDASPGQKTLTYRAEDVVDFAWTASQRYRIYRDKWMDIPLTILMQPEHESQWQRHARALKATLDYFADKMEKFPYPSITLVDPPIHALGSGGMEYPMLFTAGTLWHLPAGFLMPEMVTVHEFEHNYFMGILATNEFEEAWMDEGINSYFESKIMDHIYGSDRSWMDFPRFYEGDVENQRLGYTGMSNPHISSIAVNAWDFRHGGYSSLTYYKTAIMLHTLERLVGQPTMDEIMRTYYSRWKFKHPSGKDFIQVVNEIVTKNHGNRFGESMNGFFDQVLYGTGICDYKLAYIQSERIMPPMGVYESETGKKIFSLKATKDKRYRSRIIIHRLGEVILPIEILVHFENGEEITETWNGTGRSFELTYEKASKVTWAKIDPQEKILLDVNMKNNSYSLRPERGYFRKAAINLLFALQNIFQTLTLLA